MKIRIFLNRIINHALCEIDHRFSKNPRHIVYDILAENDEGLCIHTKYGYSVPRRNGKKRLLPSGSCGDSKMGR